MLSAEETRAAEALLADAWGPGVEVRSAEKLWHRSHVLRLRLADGRSVVLKRGRDADSGEPLRGFRAEVAALSFLNGMETPVAPRLLGATVLTRNGARDAGLLIEAALTAALGSWVVARGPAVGQALEEDEDWGTTTERPRALTWLRSFADAAARSGALPRLRALAEAMHGRLSARWPEATVPDYPALARPGAKLARPPEDWDSAIFDQGLGEPPLA
jgi:hypothetical protein